MAAYSNNRQNSSILIGSHPNIIVLKLQIRTAYSRQMGEAGEILLFHPFYVHLLLNSFKKLPKLTSKCKKQLYSIFFNVNLIFFDRNISWKIATFAKSSVARLTCDKGCGN